MKFKYRWWGKGDIDASIGIFFDGFSKILSRHRHHAVVFGMPADIVLGRLQPGVGLAISLRATCGIFTRRGPWLKKSSAKM